MKSFDVDLAPRVMRCVFAALFVAAACSDNNLTTAVASEFDTADLRYPIASVAVDPAVVSRNVGDSGAFTATVRDTRGRIVYAPVTWSVSNSDVVRLHSNGTAFALTAGTATVTATAGGKKGYSQVTILAVPMIAAPVATVTVSPPAASGSIGDSVVFSATVRDSSGNTLTDRLVTWSSSNTAAVTISAAGMARGVGAGAAQLIATVEGIAGTANVTVTPPVVAVPVVASVQVTPGSATGAVNDSAQFLAIALDSAGAEIADKTVAWSSTDNAVVVVSASGMGRAVGAGSAQLVATVDGVSGHSDITVLPPPPTPAPVASVTIAPTTMSVNTGASATLAATLRDANGNILTGRSVSWSSSNGLVASVSAGGTVTGLVAGSATITATSEGVSGSAGATVTLLPPPPSGGNWPNMPGAYSTLTDQPFNPLSVLNWQLIWNNNGYGTIASDATAPLTGSSVFQVMYPVGFQAGTAPATQYFPLGGKNNVYIGMWWKANANWQGHESNVNKIQFLYLGGGGGDIYMTAYGPPGGPFELRTNLQLVGGDSRDWLRPNVGNGTITMGEWHRLEWLVEYNTSGANGVVKMWMDGVLVGSYTDVVFPPGTSIGEYKLSPTWGGMGGIAKQQTDYFWYDHVTISTR